MRIKQLILVLIAFLFRENVYCQFNLPEFEDSVAIIHNKDGYDYYTIIYKGKGKKMKDEKDGIWKYYDEKNNIRIEGNYYQNKKDGIWKIYFANGKLQTLGKYNNDKPDSIWISYFKNGKTNWTGLYKDSLMQQKWSFYYSNDSLAGTGYFINGNGTSIDEIGIPENGRDGKWTQYYSNGNIRSENYWKKNHLFGKSYKYYESGTIESIDNYSNDGKRVGVQTTYYENGKIRDTENYTDGMLDGIKKTFNKDSYLESETAYKNGNLHGLHKEWKYYKSYGYKPSTPKTINNDSDEDEDNIEYYLEEATNFEDGERNGTAITYYSNGKKRKELYYVNDNLDGIQKEWSEDGILEETTTYKNDKKEGLHQVFDESGILVETENYKDDELNGQYISYWTKDTIKQTVNYKNGLKIGKEYTYYESGKLATEANYIDDEKYDGLVAEYYEDGTILKKENYKNNILDGDFEQYLWTSRELVAKGKYVNGKKDGLWRTENTFLFWHEVYFEEDEDSSYVEINYKKGKNDGTANIYYLSGELQAKGKIDEQDNQTGLWIEYYKNGSKKSEIEYPGRECMFSNNKYWNIWDKNKKQIVKDGEGIFNLYHANNKLKISGKIHNGLKEGVWNKYDTIGLLTSCNYFFPNELFSIDYPNGNNANEEDYEDEYKILKQTYNQFYVQYFKKLKWINVNNDFDIAIISAASKTATPKVIDFYYRIWNTKGEILTDEADVTTQMDLSKYSRFFYNSVLTDDIKSYLLPNQTIILKLKNKKLFTNMDETVFYVQIKLFDID